jgi:hypothetical protein
MVLTDVGRIAFGPGVTFPSGGVQAISSFVMNDPDMALAGIWRMPKAGTIDRVLLSVSGRTGTSTTVLFNIGVVTVDASGNATTTPFGGSALETRSVNQLTIAPQIITLATPATVAKDDLVAARVWAEGTVPPDASNNITLRARLQSDATIIPYEQEVSAAAVASKNGTYPLISLQYSDGQYVGVPTTGSNTTAFGSGSTPNEWGALFTVPFACTCVGMGFFYKHAAAATGRISLYDNAGTLQRSATYPGVTYPTNYGRTEFEWAGYDLAPATSYRLSNLATSADNRQHIDLGLGASGQRASLPQGSSWQRSTRTNAADAGAWTETATAVPMMYLLLSHIDFEMVEGGGGGGGGGQGGLFF